MSTFSRRCLISSLVLAGLLVGRPVSAMQNTRNQGRRNQGRETKVVNRALPPNVILYGYGRVTDISENDESIVAILREHHIGLEKGTVLFTILTGTHGQNGSGNPNGQSCREVKFTKDHDQRAQRYLEMNKIFGHEAIKYIDFHEFKKKGVALEKLAKNVTHLYLFDWCFSSTWAAGLKSFSSLELSRGAPCKSNQADCECTCLIQ